MFNAEMEVRRLHAENRRLWQEVYKRPIKIKGGGGSTPQISIQIIGGNTLSDGVTAGIKWSLSSISTVPSIYDPDVDTTFIAGIGRAWLYLDNVIQPNRVLVGNFSGNGGPIIRALVADEIIFAGSALLSIPLVSDATQSVSVYVPASP